MRKTKVILNGIALLFMLLAILYISPVFATSYNINKTTLDLDISDVSNINDLVLYENNLYFTDGTDIFNTTGDLLYTSPTGIITALDAADNKLIFIKENLYLYILDLDNLSEAREISIYKNENTVEPFPTQNRAIAASATGEIYLISGNTLAKVTHDETTNDLILNQVCELIFEEMPLEFTVGNFAVNEFGTFGYFNIDENLYKINLKTYEITQISTEITQNILDICVDSLEIVYCYSGSALYKISEIVESVEVGIGYSKFALDYTTGACYLAQQNTIEKFAITSELGNFITTYSEIEAPIDLYNYTQKSEVVDVLRVDAGTKLYEYQSLNSPSITYSDSKSVILLQNSSEHFYYVLDSNLSGTYKLGYILKSDSAIQSIAISSQQVRVVVKQTKLYNLPFSVKKDETAFAPFGARVDYGTTLDTVEAPTFPSDCSGTNFIAVKFEGNVYYIDSRTAVGVEFDTAIDNTIVSNASTRAETIVYADEGLSTEQDTLEKGFSITVLETTNGICKIQYLINGEIKQGYVSQSFVNDGTLTITQIIGIVLMILSLILAIIIAIVISLNNKKRRENKTV